MASKMFLFVFLFCVLSVALAFPVEVKTSESLKKSDVAAPLSDKLVLSSSGFGEKLLRTKRGIVTYGKCADGQIWYKGRCRTQEEYNELLSGDYDYEY